MQVVVETKMQCHHGAQPHVPAGPRRRRRKAAGGSNTFLGDAQMPSAASLASLQRAEEFRDLRRNHYAHEWKPDRCACRQPGRMLLRACPQSRTEEMRREDGDLVGGGGSRRAGLQHRKKLRSLQLVPRVARQVRHFPPRERLSVRHGLAASRLDRLMRQ